MSKRIFIWFGILILVLAVLIPWLAFRSRGDAETGQDGVAASLKSGQSLFQTNCGTCHSLYSAGTDGNYGPNLDELLAPSGAVKGDEIKSLEGRVLLAVEKGLDSGTPGRMPPGILNPEQAKEVAHFVAATAGEG